jgi:acetyl-CoA carboxylase carboxyl transferase subunit alpha
MPPELLDFEEPVGVLLKEIDALSLMPQTEARAADIARLRGRVDELRAELFRSLTAWQVVQVSRHAARPGTLDYLDRLFTDVVEVHGDRRFADDPAIVCAMAGYHGAPVLVIGHQKGRTTKEKIARNFGYARPEGYRKALRAMRMAEKFRRPIIVFVDTPAAYPGIESEERGVAGAGAAARSASRSAIACSSSSSPSSVSFRPRGVRPSCGGTPTGRSRPPRR